MTLRRVIIFILILFGNSFSQEIDNLYNLISDKIESDKNYLNVYSLNVPANIATSVKNIPKFTNGNKIINFKYEEGIQYYFLFLGETAETDSLVLLSIIEEKDPSVSGDGGFFTATSGNVIYDSTQFLNFKDLQELYFENNLVYNNLYKLIRHEIDLNNAEPLWLLKSEIKDGALNKSKGISGKNNQDYLNDVWVNSEHYFPKPKVQKNRGGRQKKVVNFPYYLDATFSRITMHHTDYFALDPKKMNIISLELSADDNALNLLPWQSMTMALGLRTFLSISDVVQNVYDDFLINAKIMGRFRLNTSGFFNAPFIFTEKPKLNVSSGLIFELNTTRAVGLPFINFYYSGGVSDYSNPYVNFGSGDSTWSYFSTNQWFVNMSFYWNTNETLNLRFRTDVGLGAYDVIKAVNYKGGISSHMAYYAIQPFLKFYFTFVPNKVELMGVNARFFDSIIKGKIWLKLFVLNDIHTFRFAVNFVSSPFFRNLFEWENDGGTSIQLNYRLGFK